MDRIPHVPKKCPIIIGLCLLVLSFPRVGIRVLKKSLNDCERAGIR